MLRSWARKPGPGDFAELISKIKAFLISYQKTKNDFCIFKVCL